MSNATSKTPAAATSKPSEFDNLTTQLASVDLELRSLAGNTAQVKAKRQTIAVDTIKAAYKEKIDPITVRKALLAGGVLKGTVSKIVTVLTALNDKTLPLGSVKSLNSAYTDVKRIALASSTGGPAVATPAPAAPVKLTTQNDVVAAMMEIISNDKDPLKAASNWITRLTHEITAFTKSYGVSAEDE